MTFVTIKLAKEYTSYINLLIKKTTNNDLVFVLMNDRTIYL